MGTNPDKNKAPRPGSRSKPTKKKKMPLKLTVSRTHKPEDLSLEEWQRTLRKEYGFLQRFILKAVLYSLFLDGFLERKLDRVAI